MSWIYRCLVIVLLLNLIVLTFRVGLRVGANLVAGRDQRPSFTAPTSVRQPPLLQVQKAALFAVRTQVA